ncbi:MAG: pyridoxamine 5'-phosphate oxidase [Melioribacteraceae bacterium]|nr:pyridoxamine 5'-phosphate oxidase [Melioribacteraceae bacterium]MCF8355296.1 pyridoxamine 5'-phosphate oxidase [Melioribacteraceae bacterium]MCF8394142.1 pyridoxamine 5'-phosphate oxidase [Melioribacteraceae bacterium]MCF8418119.1 pyridoxamine 5'-phosphate oxidase [Melioribacteraceae bacterium]
MSDIRDLRSEYMGEPLNKSEVDPNPVNQFKRWFEEAIRSSIIEPTAMTLATVSETGQPSARIVLLKGFNEKGFTFFTNYESRKGKELAANKKASLLFFWSELHRQIRIEGEVEKLPVDESEQYFNSRPEASRISAIVSEQSKVIPGRKYLERLVLEFDRTKIERPPNWGGYLLKPVQIEFWQGRENRLHDRILYKSVNNKWEINRLAP